MTRINIHNLLLWIEDLETTTAPQVQHTLAKPVDVAGTIGYCCLGRACEVAIANGLKVIKVEDNGFLYDGSCSYLPASVVIWLGMTENPVIHNYKGEKYTADDMNDALEYSFAEIAKAFREEYAEEISEYLEVRGPVVPAI